MGGPLSSLSPLLYVSPWTSSSLRSPLPGGSSRRNSAATCARSYAKGVHFGGSALCRYVRPESPHPCPRRVRLSTAERASAQLRACVHFGGFLLCSYMEAGASSPFRSSLRGRLRPSFRSSLRGSAGHNARQRPSLRRLRAWRFADIPTPPPGQSIKSVTAVVVALSIFSASLALDACAIATALAPQRFSTASATVVASALATTQRLSGSVLARQRFAARSQAWGSA